MSVWTTQETCSYIVDGTGDKLNNVWSTPEERAFDVMSCNVMFLFLLETITFAYTRKPFHIVQALYMLLSNFNPSHNQHLPKVLKCFVLIWLTNSTTGHYQCPITWLYTGKIVFYSQVCSFPSFVVCSRTTRKTASEIERDARVFARNFCLFTL